MFKYRFKSIFGKHVFMYLSILAISFMILGISLSQVYRSYFISRQEAGLIRQGDKMSKLILDTLNTDGFGNQSFEIDILTRMRIEEEASFLKDYLDSDFIFTTNDMQIAYRTAEVNNQVDRINVEDIPGIDKAFDGEIITVQGTLGNMYDKSKLTVVYPLMSDRALGFIFMSSSMDSIVENITEVINLTVTFILLTGAVAFVFIYATSRSISKPLQEMNKGAKDIASGNFEKRIEVEGIDEVGQLAESFNFMAKSLDEQEKTRREFIANISHDLRSPLTSIIGFLQAILDGTIEPENQERYLNIILEECKRLSKLANDLLDISKFQILSDVELYPEEFDFNELVRKSILSFETRAIEKYITLDIHFANEVDIIWADYDKINRIVNNLIDNAIKFTPINGTIKIETSIKDNKLYFGIKDNGVGISKDDQKRIFERFYKADSSRGEDKGGSGLGLAIVNDFVKVHGGQISLKSDIGKGSEFIFYIPIIKMEDEIILEENK